MALEESKTEPTKKNEPAKQTVALKVRLTSADHADRPILSNYTTLSVAPGMVYLDFGFLDPHALMALRQTALDGTLAVRVAVGYDVLQNLHQQLGQVLQGLRGASAGKP